ncbi:thiamine pyrophosphate-dependent enzyme [Mycolicibacterium vaccae]|uniref:thiamine pyrophosphate-dependent enzyme n=1 Tax=Mycolicibacterium vaccae TaxID=1810 RepID=UPI003CFE6561
MRLAGDIVSVLDAPNAGQSELVVSSPPEWPAALDEHKSRNVAKMADQLAANPQPMHFYNALREVRDVVRRHPELYLVNEGANTLDVGRDVIDMEVPRRRLDWGTWGIMGIGMGYAIGAAAPMGQPVLTVQGDSAFGFSGMEVETLCRYRPPVAVLILNNGGVYRGDDVDPAGPDPAPTVLARTPITNGLSRRSAGVGHHVRTRRCSASTAMRCSPNSGTRPTGSTRCGPRT